MFIKVECYLYSALTSLKPGNNIVREESDGRSIKRRTVPEEKRERREREKEREEKREERKREQKRERDRRERKRREREREKERAVYTKNQRIIE